MNAILKTELSPLRVGRITGSRVGAILGLNPYSTRADVLREMVRQAMGAAPEFTGNAATAYGEAKEPETLALYEAREGVMTYGGGDCIVHPDHEFLAVTPDGLVGMDGMVECKAPYRGNYTTWREVPHYVAQMRLQMACAERDWCDFAVLQRDGTLHVSRLEHDPQWLDGVLPSLESFMAAYRDALDSPEPFLSARERDDSEWQDAVMVYRAAIATAKRAEEQAEAAKKSLIALAGEQSASGFGVSVSRVERAGSVAYAKAIKDHLPDLDLVPYTGKPTTYFTVKDSA